ncbi:MAG TPA: hypothetical protein VFU47_10005, partial [Armatimonadota bacterium]|nr:hypothetical protein [Armatimonadota bacterium]
MTRARLWVRCAPVLGILAAGGLAAAGAQASPRLTLKLENVTLREALQSVEKETGWDLRIDHRSVRDEPPAGESTPRASFAWTDASLGRICGDMAEKYGFTAKSWGQRVINFEPGAVPVRSPYSASRGGYAFVPIRINRYFNTQADLTANPPAGAQRRPEVSRSGTLTMLIRPDHGDPDTIRGIEKIQVVTDAGPARSGDDGTFLRQGASYNRVDEWELQLSLGELPEGARKIRQLSGELVCYRKVQWVRAEVPLPAGSLPVKRTAGPISLLVKSVDLSRKDAVQADIVAEWASGITLNGEIGGSPTPMLRLRSGTLVGMNW